MMTAQSRLKVCALMVVLSVLYGWVIATQGSEVASAIGIGYVALILTGFLVVNVWKRP